MNGEALDHLREVVHDITTDLHKPLVIATAERAERLRALADLINEAGSSTDRVLLEMLTALAIPEPTEALVACRRVDEDLSKLGVGPEVGDGAIFNFTAAPYPHVFCPQIVQHLLTDYPFHRGFIEVRAGSDAGAQHFLRIYLARVRAMPRCCEAHIHLRRLLLRHTACLVGQHSARLARWDDAREAYATAAKVANELGELDIQLTCYRELLDCLRRLGATKAHSQLLAKAARLATRLDRQQRLQHEAWIVPLLCATEAFQRRGLSPDLSQRALAVVRPGTAEHTHAVTLLAYTARSLGDNEAALQYLALLPTDADRSFNSAWHREAALCATRAQQAEDALKHLRPLIDEANKRIGSAHDFSDMRAAIELHAPSLLRNTLALVRAAHPLAAIANIEMLVNAGHCRLLRSRRHHDGSWYFGVAELSARERAKRMQEYAQRVERTFLYFVLSPDGSERLHAALIRPNAPLRWVRFKHVTVRMVDSWWQAWGLAEQAAGAGNAAAVVAFKEVIAATTSRLQGLFCDDVESSASDGQQPLTTSIAQLLRAPPQRKQRPHGLVIVSHGSMDFLPTQAIEIAGNFNLTGDGNIFPTHSPSVWGHHLSSLSTTQAVADLLERATKEAEALPAMPRGDARDVLSLRTVLLERLRQFQADTVRAADGHHVDTTTAHMLLPTPTIIVGDGLRAAADEAKMVSESWPGAVTYRASACTRGELEALLAESAFLHVIGHARPAHSGGRANLELGTERNLHFDVGDVLRLRPEFLKLVVLSSCRNFVVPSRGSLCSDIDLAQAFLTAGANQVLTSMWSVDDRATSAFMALFWFALAFGRCASCAVSYSRMAMQSKAAWPDAFGHRFTVEERSEWAHPYYWGAFRLMGAG